MATVAEALTITASVLVLHWSTASFRGQYLHERYTILLRYEEHYPVPLLSVLLLSCFIFSVCCSLVVLWAFIYISWQITSAQQSRVRCEIGTLHMMRMICADVPQLPFCSVRVNRAQSLMVIFARHTFRSVMLLH